jgi:hypothetical protein
VLSGAAPAAASRSARADRPRRPRAARAPARGSRRVVGAEGDQPPVRDNFGDAALHQLPDVERVGVLKILHDQREHLLLELVELAREVDAAALACKQRTLCARGCRRREHPLQCRAHLLVRVDPVRDVIEVVLDLEQPGEGHDRLAVDEGVAHRAAAWEAAGHRHEVVEAEPFRHLRRDKLHHVRVREPLERIELDVSAGVRDWLEGDAVDRRITDAEAHDLAQLVLVHALLDSAYERHRQALVGTPRERALLVGAQVLAADREVRLELEAVELQVDVRLQPPELARELGVARDPDPVRVQHHDANPLPAGELDEVEDLRVDRRFAPRELHHLRRPLGRDEPVEHEVDLL